MTSPRKPPSWPAAIRDRSRAIAGYRLPASAARQPGAGDGVSLLARPTGPLRTVPFLIGGTFGTFVAGSDRPDGHVAVHGSYIGAKPVRWYPAVAGAAVDAPTSRARRRSRASAEFFPPGSITSLIECRAGASDCTRYSRPKRRRAALCGAKKPPTDISPPTSFSSSIMCARRQSGSDTVGRCRFGTERHSAGRTPGNRQPQAPWAHLPH